MEELDNSIPEVDFKAIKHMLNDVKTLVPLLINLTGKERLKNFKLSKKRYQFLMKATEAAQVHSGIIPPYVNLERMNFDIKLYDQLTLLEEQISELSNAIKGTKIKVGADALRQSMEVYQTLSRAGKAGVEGAEESYLELKELFPGRGKAKKAIGSENESQN
ncbi:MAG: hypothetical protein NTX03_13275 [Bacteroidetes bacterium]|nr:hypothetical protein [Bacteroidota bacterium]